MSLGIGHRDHSPQSEWILLWTSFEELFFKPAQRCIPINEECVIRISYVACADDINVISLPTGELQDHIDAIKAWLNGALRQMLPSPI